MKNIITAFKEHKIFKHNRPWDINTMTFSADITTPPHYADTIEVLLCCNAKGDIYIGGNKFELGGTQIFYIPPQVVHSVFYKKCDGFVKVLKVNAEQLKPFFDIEEILRKENKTFLSLPSYLPYFDEMEYICDTFKTSTHCTEVCKCILDLFYRLIIQSDSANLETLKNDIHGHNLRKVILWTEQHLGEKISLQNAANLVGYEKHYFCNKFKNLTGISYMNYVNNLRIQYACELLTKGETASSVCEQCGFDNLSYFIQLFKKITGATPKAFSKSITEK